MKRVYACSPYAGDIEHNKENAAALALKIMDAGHAPFVPHLMYTQFLDDSDADERALGIECGCAFLETCDEVWAFVGDGYSAGMLREILEAKQMGIPVKEILEL